VIGDQLKEKSKEISSLFEAIYFNFEELDFDVFLTHLSGLESQKSLKERVIELPLLDYGKYHINVKLPSSQIISFYLNKNQTISKLKEALAKEIKMKASKENFISTDELNQLKELQEAQNKALTNLANIEVAKHDILNENSQIREALKQLAEKLESQYGKININLEDGAYTPFIEE
jgi:hypothetical protein